MGHFTCVTVFQYVMMASGFITTVTTESSDADVNLSIMVSQVAILEKAMSTLQDSYTILAGDLNSTSRDLRVVLTELATTKNEMRVLETGTKTCEVELNTTRTQLKVNTYGLTEVKTRLRSAESEIMSLKKDKRLRTNVTDLAMMKMQLAELESVSKTSYNRSIINTIDTDVKSNRKEVKQLHSKVSRNSQNIANTKLDIDLNARDQRDLRRRFNSLGTLVNMTLTGLANYETTQNAMRTNMSAMLTQNHNITHDLAALISLILKSRRNVAFQVAQTPKSSRVKSPVAFGNVRLNSGGGYDSSTGYFNAPVSGTYVFWMHMVMYLSSGDCSVMKGNTIVAWATGHTSSLLYWSTASATGVVHLHAGENVAVTCRPGITTWADSHFGGMLIHSD